MNKASKEARVYRGGTWLNVATTYITGRARYRNDPSDSNFSLGFRCARARREKHHYAVFRQSAWGDAAPFGRWINREYGDVTAPAFYATIRCWRKPCAV